MKITEILKKKKTFSFEFFPPKNQAGIETLAASVKNLSLLSPDFISITDSGSGEAKFKHLGLSRVIMEKTSIKNIILHLTCINSSMGEIESSLNEAARLGIENVLALRGDKSGSNTPSSFRYASELTEKIKKDGRFCIGVAAHPETHPEAESPEKDLENLKRKADAGGEFAITQLFFDNSSFFSYRERAAKAGIKIPIIPGIMPVAGMKSLERIKEKTGKIKIPPALMEIFEKAGPDKEEFLKHSADFASKQCAELLKNGVPGIHIFTFNKSLLAKRVFEEVFPHV